MFRNKKWLRLISVFLLVNIVGDLFFPTVSMALTSGPTAPEYTDFEPADATDMVNLATGDFVYNMPLFNVPGPEGGYPINLAYHSGIQPNQEASWVGLGWSLNMGAINRFVNNVPDDINGVRRDARSYWKGGVSLDMQAGAGFLGNRFTADAAWDTYKGFGLGYYVDLSIPVSGAINESFSFGQGPYGEAYNGVGVGIGYKGLIFAGISTTTYGDQTSNELSIGTLAGGVGVDLGNGKVSGDFSISNNGPRSAVYTNSGQLSTYTKESGLGHLNLLILDVTELLTYTRYWSDVYNYVDNFGSLYYHKADYTLSDNNISAHQSLDSYVMIDQRDGIDITVNPEKGVGGSLPSFDSYIVAANGIGGVMQPYILEDVSLFRQSQSDDMVSWRTNPFNSTKASVFNLNQGSKVNFRFANDFSNSFLTDLPYFYDSDNGGYVGSDYSPDPTPKKSSSTGFNADRNMLAGSRHIEWFSNIDIDNNNAKTYGFLKYPSFTYSTFTDQVHFNDLYDIGTNFTDQVGGFMITNSNGVTYHYALPVYAYGEYTRTQKIDDTGLYRWEAKREPYAYTWLLTAITGPDFVDRGGGTDLTSANGVLDDADWGYWVKFDYGKWTDKYNWRSPAQGVDADLDTKYTNYSYGYKQLYYLDAIRTRSHTAIFVKDIRQDAKGVSDFVNGEFLPKVINTNSCPDAVNSATLPPGQDPETNPSISQVNYQAYPVSTLKLEEIYLLTNQVYDEFITNEFTNLDNFKRSDPWAPQGQSNTCSCPSPFNPSTITDYIKDYSNIHLQDNVIDVHDNLLATLRLSALKVADFTYTYDLCQGTPNSLPNSIADANANFANIKPAATLPATPLDYAYQSTAVASADFIAQNKSFGGKLTLVSLDLLGKGGVKVVPSIKLDYGVTNADGTLNLVNNPNYDKDKYDIWGYYKSDFSSALYAINQNSGRFVTQNSTTANQDYSAWNLKNVTSPFGSILGIEYEADIYSSVLQNKAMLRLETMKKYAVNQFKLTFAEKNINLSNIYKIGDNLELTAEIVYKRLVDADSRSCYADKQKTILIDNSEINYGNPVPVEFEFLCNRFIVDIDVNIEEIGADYLVVSNLDLYNSLYNTPYTLDFNLTMSYRSDGEDEPVAVQSYTFNTWPETLMSGLISSNNRDLLGGGVRISSIKYNDENKSFSTNYNYVGGVSSYEPYGILEAYVTPEYISYFKTALNATDDDLVTDGEKTRRVMKKYFYANYKKIIANPSIIPPPGVMYSQVEITQQVSDINSSNEEINPRALPGKAVFQFETYQSTEDPGSDDVVYSASESNISVNTNQISVQDFSSRIGQLKKSTYYQDNSGNILLSDVTNTYLHDLHFNASTQKFDNSGIISDYNYIYKFQGVTEQQFHDFRSVAGSDKFVTTNKAIFPSILVSQVANDYRTGLSNKITYKGFDFYNGLPNSQLQTSSDGNYILTNTQYAYNQYSGMGLKVTSNTNKNMLSQLYSTEVYKSDATGTQSGLMGASVQTWDDGISILDAPNAQQTGIFRKKATYQWLGNAGDVLNADNTYPATAYSKDITNSGWLKTGEITFYDPFSHVLESKDADGNYSASIINYNNTKIMMSGTGGRLTDFAYAGLENPLIDNRERGVFTGGASNALNYSVPESHTGNYSLIVSPTNIGFNTYIPKTSFTAASGFKTGQTYTASVWVYMPGYSESETNPVELSYGFVNADGSSYTTQGSAYPVAGSKSKSWYLIKLNNILASSSNDLFIYTKNNSATRSVYMDDFRVQPANASASAYVYDQNTNEITYVLDNSNLYTNYQYDDAGKVVRSMKEIFYTTDKLLMEIKENYARKD